MFKHIWAIANKEDSLWLRWIHHVYVKEGTIWEHKAPGQSSWYWSKMVAIKDEFQESYKDKTDGKYKMDTEF